jgi:tyrosinase
MSSYAKTKKGLKTAKKGGKVSPDQALINDFLQLPKAKSKAKKSSKLGFSPFIAEENEKAYQLTAEFMKIANDNPDDPIKKVLERAKVESETKDTQLVQTALLSFITYHPAARKKNLRIPPAVQRSPGTSVPKKKKIQLAPGPVVSHEKAEEADDDIESYMNWYREDPNLSEHHEHWHIVYNNTGIPNPKNPLGDRVHKDRHGELFIYMHRQMLARYDVERLGLGLPLIKPLDDYRGPILEKYKPNENLVDRKDDYTTFGSRESNTKLRGSEIFSLEHMETSRKRVEEAIKAGQFYDGTKIDINLLGAIIESYQLKGVEKLIDYYGSLHGAGHVNLALCTDDPV